MKALLVLAVFGVFHQSNATAANGVAPVIAQAEFVRTKVSTWVQNKAATKKYAPIIVVLKNQLDQNIVEQPTFKALTAQERAKKIYSDLTSVAAINQISITKYLKSKKIKFRSLYILNAIIINQAKPSLIDALAARADVARIVGDPSLKFQKPAPVARTESDFRAVNGAITEIGADRVWAAGFTGQGIVIAGQDTGVQWDHPALKNKYRGSNGTSADHNYSWHDAVHQNLDDGANPCGLNTRAPCDDDQHGTHTVGTMVGDDGAGNQIGVAPGSKWIACRNMERGFGTPSQYLECFQWMLAPYAYNANPMTDGRPEFAPHVINNSWGCPAEEGCSGTEFIPVLQTLKAAGIMVVVSAGNEGPGCGTIADAPAHHLDLALVVGAYNHRNGTIAGFSSRGPSGFMDGIGPHIVAPGVNIKSSVPGDIYEVNNWSGTSMAGPHVAGLVALLWSAAPNLKGKIDETINLITRTAFAKTTTESCGGVSGLSIPNNTYGYGQIRAFEAFQTALSLR